MGTKTLIIEDDPVFAGYMTSLLEAAGIHQIVCIGDAKRTIEQRSVAEFDRIVCDLNMPDMDGIEFIEQLAAESWTGDLIIVSGEARNVILAAERLARFAGLKVAGTLKKPVKLADLLHILNDATTNITGHTSSNVLAARKSYIQQAIEQASVTPVYQPQFNLATMKVDGFEALMRLELKDGSLASPNEFFDILTQEEEEAFALKQSELILRDFRTWLDDGALQRCSINLSPRLLSQNSVAQNLIELCKRLSIDPSQIILEVTEHEPLIDAPNLISAMSRLRIAGFGLALDDFGSGHANIQELGWFPFSEIKTDLNFGRDMLEDQFALAAVEFAVRAAKQLELELVVEGLESVEAVALARKLGAHRGQGFAISRPLCSHNAQKLALAS